MRHDQVAFPGVIHLEHVARFIIRAAKLDRRNDDRGVENQHVHALFEIGDDIAIVRRLVFLGRIEDEAVRAGPADQDIAGPGVA